MISAKGKNKAGWGRAWLVVSGARWYFSKVFKEVSESSALRGQKEQLYGGRHACVVLVWLERNRAKGNLTEGKLDLCLPGNPLPSGPSSPVLDSCGTAGGFSNILSPFCFMCDLPSETPFFPSFAQRTHKTQLSSMLTPPGSLP